MNNIYTKIIYFTILLFCSIATDIYFTQNLTAQPTGPYTLNDGQIRLRVWASKVWTNANCSDPGAQEYVYRGIRVKPHDDINGTGWSPGGVNVKMSGDENRWWDLGSLAASDRQVPAGNSTWPMTVSATGIQLLDVTYSASQVPTAFDWSISESWEDDHTPCIWPCDSYTSPWTYESSWCCGALGDENYMGYQQGLAINPFRGAPAGQVSYVQTDVWAPGGFLAEEQSYAVLFAFQWDWVDPLDPLPITSVTPTPTPLPIPPEYQDGPLQLDVQLMGVFSDSDYDWGANCVFGVADDEDLRVKWRAKDNISSFSGTATCNSLSQPWPQWNVAYPIATLLNKNYTTAQINFKEFEVELELWEEDCSPDCAYNSSGCFLGIGADDAYYFGTTGLINWRNSIPSVGTNAAYWNYIDVPLRTSSTSYANWTVWLRYRWIQAAPTVAGVGPFDRPPLCVGTPTTLSVTTTAATFYQWQVTDVTGDDNGEPFGSCPASATWTDVSGAYWKDFIPPQTPGTRIYRCRVRNRTGAGSYTATGTRYQEAYSECFRVTYFPYAPPISSVACNGSIVGGVPYSFSTLVTPAVGAVANATSYTWTVSPSAGVTISAPNATTTNITFPNTTTTYTITLTVADACAATNATSVCTTQVTQDYCGDIYVSTTGSDINPGGPSNPVASLQIAIALANGSGGVRNHIKMLGGNYAIASPINLASNITIEGDYILVAGEWVKSTAIAAIVNLNCTENLGEVNCVKKAKKL
jgi:hypothetical protein